MKLEYISVILMLCVIYYIFISRTELFTGGLSSNSAPISSDYIDENFKIYFINLKNRPYKKTYMEDQLKVNNLKYNVFEAIDGNKLSIDNLNEYNLIDQSKSYTYMKRAMRRGEIGCSLSHIFIWNEMAISKYKYFMIFEDDAILAVNFKQKLKRIIKDIEDMDWDILYLNDNCYSHFGDNCNGNIFSLTTIKPNRVGYGLYGYVINKQFINKCIKESNNSNENLELFPLYMPIDDYIDYKSKKNELKCIRSKEIIVDVNRKFDSDTIDIK